jgi:hypothetical protein
MQKKYLIPLLCLFFLFLLSCRTAPTLEAPAPESGFVPFEPGAFAYYMSSDVQQLRPILERINFSIMNDKQVRQILDKTVSAMAAVYMPSAAHDGNTPQSRFQLAAWGNYPAGRIKMALGLQKNWKKIRSPTGTPAGTVYWHSAKDGISIAVDSRRIFIFTGGGNVSPAPFPAENTAPGISLSAEFIEFCRENKPQGEPVLSGWFDNPKEYVNQKLEEMGMPIELPADNIFFNLFATEEQKYEAFIRMQLSTATQARGIVTLFGLARNFISPGAVTDSYSLLAAILFSNPPVQSDKNLDIRSGVLSAAELSLLFDLFSVR